MVFLDGYGYPVVTFKGRPVLNFLRLLIHARKLRRGYWNGYEVVPNGETRPAPTCDNIDTEKT